MAAGRHDAHRVLTYCGATENRSTSQREREREVRLSLAEGKREANLVPLGCIDSSCSSHNHRTAPSLSLSHSRLGWLKQTVFPSSSFDLTWHNPFLHNNTVCVCVLLLPPTQPKGSLPHFHWWHQFLFSLWVSKQPAYLLCHHFGNISHRAMKAREVSARMAQQPLIRSKRIHQQMYTTRKRYLSVESISEDFGWLILETEVITITTRHRCRGRIAKRMVGDFRSKNTGLISRHIFTELVKLIHLKDIPDIIEDFDSGISMDRIRYSSWPEPIQLEPVTSSEPATLSTTDCLQVASFESSTLSTRLIKGIGNWIGIH